LGKLQLFFEKTFGNCSNQFANLWGLFCRKNWKKIADQNMNERQKITKNIDTAAELWCSGGRDGSAAPLLKTEKRKSNSNHKMLKRVSKLFCFLIEEILILKC
jgi:hypothetical protein